MPKARKSRRRAPAAPSQAVTTRSVSSLVNRVLHSSLQSPGQSVYRKMNNSGGFTSNGAGVIAAIVDINPNSGSYADWTSMASLYDEYRVLGAEITLMSCVTNALNQSLFVIAYDNDDRVTGLSSFENGLDYQKNKIIPSIWPNDRLYKLKADCFSAADPSTGRLFQTTAGTNYPCSFKTYAGGLTINTLYMEWCISVVVEFRGQN